jgi:hypothetical protein
VLEEIMRIPIGRTVSMNDFRKPQVISSLLPILAAAVFAKFRAFVVFYPDRTADVPGPVSVNDVTPPC